VALVRHKDAVTAAEFRIMRKVALDSVPSARLAVYEELLEASRAKRMYTVQDVADRCRISFTPASRHLKDMELLGLARTVYKDKHLHYGLTGEVQGEWRQLTSE
jgi:hypothetical protein